MGLLLLSMQGTLQQSDYIRPQTQTKRGYYKLRFVWKRAERKLRWVTASQI
jgi:hypothetical protein